MKTLCLVLAVLLIPFLSGGCWPFMPTTRTDSGSATGEYRAWDLDPATGAWVLRTEKKMSVTGPSGKTSQEGGAQAIKTGALKFKMDGMEAEGPRFGIQAEGGLEGFLANPVTIMSVIGGLAIVGAAVYWWFARDLRTALFIGAGGIGLFVCALVFEKYPLVILALFVGGIGFAAWSIWSAIQKKKIEAAKTQVDATQEVLVRAVEGAEPAVAAKIKERVTELAGKFAEEVKAVITAAKERAGI